jgi:hypothetical protein
MDLSTIFNRSTLIQVLPSDMVDKSANPFHTHFGPVFCDEAVQRGLLFPERGSIRVLLLDLHPYPHDMALHPSLALVPLKRKSAAMATRAPRAPSIVDWFSLLPSLGSAGGLVVPPSCPLARVDARALLAAIHEDATSVIVGAPPLQMGEQGWGLLRRRPGAAGERCYPMSDGQIHPLNKSGIESSREA